MKFEIFKKAVQEQFQKMAEGELFVTNTDKEVLWDLYLESFPEGTNPIFKERREYDCNCCKSFIRACGNVVSIKDNKLSSIWDIQIPDGKYKVVSKEMSKYVKSKAIKSVFRSDIKKLGTNNNRQLLENGEVKRWEHFYLELPPRFVSASPGEVVSELNSTKHVFERSMDEISIDAAETVLELIKQGSLYRGDEKKGIVNLFIENKKEYDKLSPAKRKLYLWEKTSKIGHAARFRNDVIGTLMVDISEGKPLEDAVKMFESKVAPTNYKRTTALVTQSMVKKAEEKSKELGIEPSFPRRFATVEDITINNVLFANKDTKKSMSVFDDLSNSSIPKKKLDKIEEVSIKKFIEDLLPKASTIEIMVENSHTNNFVSLIAPENEDAKGIFKWDNNFSWSYNGDVTDSIKERVKKAGGKVDGALRCSLSWFNFDDLDIHVIEPSGNRIYFSNPVNIKSRGNLDVDMNAGQGKSRNAVENITFPKLHLIEDGKYEVIVHNFSQRELKDVGFDVEIEYNGNVHNFHYDKTVKDREYVNVATFNFDKAKGDIEIIKSIPSSASQKDIWGIQTNKFQNVSMIMNSPNHWDENEIGNKHYFFMIEGCQAKESRGFYNEFLKNELNEHRKVFEILGSKMKVKESQSQLSGVGFSSTQRNHLLCKITGSFSRTIKIIF